MFSDFVEINQDLENIYIFEREDDDSRDHYSGKNNFTFNFEINKDIDYVDEEENQKIYFIPRTPLKENTTLEKYPTLEKAPTLENDLNLEKDPTFEKYPTLENDPKTPLKGNINKSIESNGGINKENTKPESSSKEPRVIKEKIFGIEKVNKKQGRLPKHQKETIKGKHNKFSEDNIIQKIKTNFQESVYNYVNYEYEKFVLKGQNYNDKNKINTVKLIKRISPKEIKKIKKEDNLYWFSLQLKVLFSSNLSSKYNKFESDYNEKRIKNLYEKKEAIKVIDILEKNVEDMYEIYINNIKIDGFGTLEDDLNALRKKMEQVEEEDIDQYLNEYEKIAKNLEEIFMSKTSRISKTKKERKKICKKF